MTYKPRTYVVTTAQRGALPNWEFLESLQTYCKHNQAEMLILPTNGKFPSSTKEDQEEILHPYLQEHFQVVDHDFKLNKKIDIRNFPTKAQQMIPLTSWGRFVQYDKSAIMASPKLMQKCYANSNCQLPKILMSTGAVTRPNYKDNAWGAKARLDHRYAAIVVEVKDANSFHYRQLVSNDNGIFYDLGWKYDGKNKPEKESVEALILGDVHVGLTDPAVVTATRRLIQELTPKNIIYHDLFDCYSVNHHHEDDLIIQAQKARNGTDNLEDEIRKVGEFLIETGKIAGPDTQHRVVKSNHDEALDRYLKEGRFAKDPKNVVFAAQLLPNAVSEKIDNLEYAIRVAYGELPRNFVFLSPNEDFKIKGWQLASHGHKGPRGKRGSVRSLETALGRAMIGHFHTPEIFRDIWAVGTSTVLDMYYTRGTPSDWVQGHGILHPNGKPQLINIIEGEYR
ncbi:MAG: hypothetical protein Q8O88_01060 [bacterium]|nr:hypothetical protein [bacterium]